MCSSNINNYTSSEFKMLKEIIENIYVRLKKDTDPEKKILFKHLKLELENCGFLIDKNDKIRYPVGVKKFKYDFLEILRKISKGKLI